jgi:aarF domain-containing kinase
MKKSKSSPTTGALGRAGKLLQLASSMAKAEIKHRAFKGDAAGSATESAKLRLQQATAMVRELGHLKGAAMKLGQMLALEARDFLPDEVVAVLEQLHSNASFMDFETIFAVIQEDLGSKANDLIDLSHEPIAAASIGQVHRAVFNDDAVAVKVQYPGIRDSIHSDVKILSVVLKTMSKLFRRELEIDGLLKEFSEVFIQETDYNQEAEAQSEYRNLAAAMPGIRVPRVYPQLSSARVLTMDFEDGLSITRWMRETNPPIDVRRRLGESVLDLYTREFCDWGLVQTDPNPGNFLIRPNTNELVLLDFGATKRYSFEFRKHYSQLVMAIFRRDKKAVRETAISLGLISHRENETAFVAFEALVFESMRPMTMKTFDFRDKEYVTTVRRLTRALVKELKFSPPPKNLIFLHRKLGGVFLILKLLAVDLNLENYLSRFKSMAESTENPDPSRLANSSRQKV